jgi:hypothetical protein
MQRIAAVCGQAANEIACCATPFLGQQLPSIVLAKGKSYSDTVVAQVLLNEKTPADFEYNRPADSELVWIHRHADLDLGAVKDVAEVSVNGKPSETIFWKPPYEVDATSAIKRGTNHIEIKVTNLWTNRVIGDHQTGATKRYTFTDFKPMNLTRDSDLLESGLLGPVRLLRVNRQ